jgi:glyoxylase-like metal-dependent hydrolase (beta-lactamase superfamily II)
MPLLGNRQTDCAADIHQITIKGSNVVLVAGKELTLIDTGFRGEVGQLMASISGLGRSIQEVSLIVLTHNHVDHVGGLAELRHATRAKVAVHRNDVGERQGRPSARAEDVDILLDDGETLGPTGDIDVIHTPGHTPGSICLLLPSYRLLVVGDSLRKRRDELHLPFRTESYDHRQAIESVKRIARLDFGILCFGHGQPLLNNAKGRVLELAERYSH